MHEIAHEPAIPNRWYGVFRSAALGRRPAAIRRFGLPLVLYRREDGTPAALLDRCSHRGAALSRGRVIGGEIECPYHAFRFDAAGRCTAIPCEGPGARIPGGMEVPSFAVREAHGFVWLWWGAPASSLGLDALPPLPWLGEIPEGPDVARGEMDYAWPASLHRTIEANFDAHHAPVIHSFGVPKLGRLTQLEVLGCEVEAETIRLRVETFDPADRAARFPVTMSCHLPGVSMVELGDLYKIVLVDAPIDDSQTWRGMLHVRPGVRWRRLGDVALRGWQRVDYWVTQLLQDLPAIRSQLLPVPGVFADKLVRADTGIAQYIRLRRQLLREESARKDVLPSLVRWASGWADASPDLIALRRPRRADASNPAAPTS